MKRFICALFSVVAVILATGSCTKDSSAPDTLLGTVWRGDIGAGYVVEWEFVTDMYMTEKQWLVTKPDNVTTYSFKYEYSSGNLTLKDYTEDGDYSYTIAITNSTITLTLIEGTITSTLILQKI